MILIFLGFIKTLNKTNLSILYSISVPDFIKQSIDNSQTVCFMCITNKQVVGVNHLFFLSGSQCSVVSARTQLYVVEKLSVKISV